MGLFDLSRFRALAFERKPDHPMENEAAARTLLADLPADDAPAALAELTHWATSINLSEDFTAGRRARVLMLLDESARPFWRELGELYLTPGGGRAGPAGRGNPAILRALFDSATEFAEGYRLALYSDADGRTRKSAWVEANWALLGLRQARWLARRLTLARMLQRPEAEIIWHHLHTLYATAEARQQSRTTLAVFPGSRFHSSIKQEYVRLHLLEMADLAALTTREIELVFRIAGQTGNAAQLEPTRLDGVVYVVQPAGVSQPVRLSRVETIEPHFLYLNTANCLPRLHGLLERDAGADANDPDTVFSGHFTLGERRSMVQRLLDHWGPNPPARRAARQLVSATARVLCGFGTVSAVLPLFDQGTWNRAAAAKAGSDLRIQLDDEEQAAQRAKKPSARQFSARVLDSSSGGIGLAVHSGNARAAALGALIGVQPDGKPDWVVGVVRRIAVQGEELHLGVQLLTRRPQLLWFHRQDRKTASPWEMERASSHEFLEYFQCAIVVRADDEDQADGQLITAAGVLKAGLILDVPLALGLLRVRIGAINEATGDYQRAAYAPLTPAGAPATDKSGNARTQKLLTGGLTANTGKFAQYQESSLEKTQKMTTTKK